MLHDLDRFPHVIERGPSLVSRASSLRQQRVDEGAYHWACAHAAGDDPPHVCFWIWPGQTRGVPICPRCERPR